MCVCLYIYIYVCITNCCVQVLAEGIWDLSSALVGLGVAPSMTFTDDASLPLEARTKMQQLELRFCFFFFTLVTDP